MVEKKNQLRGSTPQAQLRRLAIKTAQALKKTLTSSRGVELKEIDATILPAQPPSFVQGKGGRPIVRAVIRLGGVKMKVKRKDGSCRCTDSAGSFSC